MSTSNNMHRPVRKKKKSAPLIVGSIVTVILCVLLAYLLGAFGGKKEDKGETSSIYTQTESSSSEAISSEVIISSNVSSKDISSVQSVAVSSKLPVVSKTETATENALIPRGDWRLVIANKQYPLPKSYNDNVKVAYISGNYRIDARVANEYNAMIRDAKAAGIPLQLISGYRTYAGQQSLFNNKVNKLLNQGYSREKAKELAAKYVAPPGTSEHLTGLAVDVISPDWYNYNSDLNSKFENTKQFKWLYENCANYGFILRYTKDKEAVTGYSYEPWHYRYVGKEAAKEIMRRKICLEEYVNIK